MKRREKNYKIPFIICFSLIAIILIIIGVMLFKLNDKISYFDKEIEHIEHYLMNESVDVSEYNNWEETSEAIYQYYSNKKLRIEEPADWNFESATGNMCLNYTFCSEHIDYVDIVFNIGKKTAYNDFLQDLVNQINQVTEDSFVNNQNDTTSISAYIDGKINFKIELRESNGKAYMTFKNFKNLYEE